MTKPKRKRLKGKQSAKLHMEDLCLVVAADTEEEAYGAIFSGATSSVKPVWIMSGQVPIEEYWIYNCPHIKFCCRSMSIGGAIALDNSQL